MSYTTVTSAEFDELDGVDDWRAVLGAIHASFAAGSYPAAAQLTAAIAAAAEAVEHHPDIDIRYPDRVRVSLVTHAVGGLTTRDVDLARQISALARDAGASPVVDGRQIVELALDTTDEDRIRPFWRAVLGYDEHDRYLVDPNRTGPPMWFQHTDDVRTERGRFHIDVSVPHDEAEQRIEAALAAGGRMVTDEFARSWWVLADADGNEACVCTWQDR